MVRGRSPSTVVSLVLVMTVVTYQGQTLTAEVTLPMENTTVSLREEGKFFCQVMGNDAKLRINGVHTALSYNVPGDLIITVDNAPSVNSIINVSNITIMITATKKRNNTLLECYDQTMSREDASKATLIVQGGPAQPEISYEVLSQEKIVLSWPHPFTWEEYPITGYRIMCTDTDVISINNTDNRAVNRHTVELDQDITDCHSLQCNVTASNALDDSVASVTDISIPLMKANLSKPTFQIVKVILAANEIPEVAVCLKLPVLCSFQNVTYTLIISYEGGQVLELSRQFSYSSGYNSDCVEVLVTEGLQEGTQYTVQVFMDAGLSGRSYSDIETFSPKLSEETEENDDDDESPEDNASQMTSFIVDIAMGTVLLIIVAILIILTCIIVGMCRALKYNSGKASVSNRPLGATNKVFETCQLSEMGSEEIRQPVNNEPYYHTLEAPTGNQYHSHQPTEPVYHDPIHITKIV